MKKDCLYRGILFQVFMSNTDNLYTIIWFQGFQVIT